MARSNQGEEIPKRLGIREFRAKMSAVLRAAQHGSSFLVTSHDEVVAEIHPPSKALRPPRQPGALRGKIDMANDFDVLPPAILAAMEGEDG